MQKFNNVYVLVALKRQRFLAFRKLVLGVIGGATCVAATLIYATAVFAGDLASAGDVVINEFMNNPDDGANDAAGEWVELVNVSAATLNIDGWELRDDGSNSHIIDNGGTLDIAPGEYMLLCRDAAAMTGCAYEYSSFTLANSSDEIVLIDSGGSEIARINYTDGDIAGRSRFFVPTANPPAIGYYAENQDFANRWENTADDAADQFMVNGNLNYGTPGARNTQTGVPSTPTAVVVSAFSADEGVGLMMSGWLIAVTILGKLTIGVLFIMWRQQARMTRR